MLKLINLFSEKTYPKHFAKNCKDDLLLFSGQGFAVNNVFKIWSEVEQDLLVWWILRISREKTLNAPLPANKGFSQTIALNKRQPDAKPQKTWTLKFYIVYLFGPF